ncbi:MAG TPA: hypothetical protein PK078_03605 [Anaerolineales bacterium]|nr:hypothetical protein [Anaerolineales bacterium]HNC08776.1 hypothetical protein [Anaerolineales bacterium]
MSGKQIGLWIDHKRAVILTISKDGETMQILESGVDRTSFRGATHPRTPYSAQYQKGDDQLDKQFEGYLNKYYQKISTLLRNADSVLIFGPGQAKSELKKCLARRKSLPLISAVETADKMTDRQIAAKVRLYFREFNS